MKAHIFSAIIVLLSLCGDVHSAGLEEQSHDKQQRNPKATLTVPEKGEVGAPVPLLFSLSPAALPAGSFATVKVEASSPEQESALTILSGVPVTTIRFDRPGSYELLVSLTLVTKTSCAGATLTPLLERTIRIDIAKAR